MLKKTLIALLALVLMLSVCIALADTAVLPAPGTVLGVNGTQSGDVEYAGTNYTVIVYPVSIDKESFIAAYAPVAAQAGYTVMEGTEGELDALYFQSEGSDVAAILTFEANGLKLMVPAGMAFENDAQQESDWQRPTNLYVMICNQQSPSRIRSGAGSSYEMLGGAQYADFFPYQFTVTGDDGDPWYAMTFKGVTAYTPAGTLGRQSWNIRRSCVVELYKVPVYVDVEEDALILNRPDDNSTTDDYNPTLYKAVSGDRFKCYGITVDEFFVRQWYLIDYEGRYAFVSSYDAEID